MQLANVKDLVLIFTLVETDRRNQDIFRKFTF